MARIARVVVPEVPHHVVQRGNRRQDVFFKQEDRDEYFKILKKQCLKHGLKIWAYCLMRNHVHLIVVPQNVDSFGKGIGEAHKEYTRMINFREGWRGYLWEGRFKSHPLDEKYLYAAVRYVERNPVRAKIVERAEDYEWSSARAHVEKGPDEVLSSFYLLEEINDWSKYLATSNNYEEGLVRQHSQSGLPLGDEGFVLGLEKMLGRRLQRMKPGKQSIH